MKQKKWGRLLSLLLVTAMVIAMFPVAVVGAADEAALNITVALGEASGEGLQQTVPVTVSGLTGSGTYTYATTNRSGSQKTGTLNVADGAATVGGVFQYGDHVKVSDGTNDAYFKVLSNELLNGSFETFQGRATTYTVKDDNVYGWKTTASDRQIEIYYARTYGLGSAKDGSWTAELNANEMSSLYQEVSTTPGDKLTWNLYHGGRASTTYNTMAVVIGPAISAEENYTKSTSNDKDMFMTIAESIKTPEVGKTYNVDGYTVVIISDKQGQWNNYTGVYTVPANQTETVFAFVSIGGTAEGNVLDAITFGKYAVATAEVADDDTITIVVDNLADDEYCAVLDKDGNPVTTNVAGGTAAGENGWYSQTEGKDSVVWSKLPAANGPYTVVRTKDAGKTPTTNDTQVAKFETLTLAGGHVAWYSDADCTKQVKTIVRNTEDYADPAEKTLYFKPAEGYVYPDGSEVGATNTASVKTTATSTNGVYQLTYTLNETTTLTADTPKQVATVTAGNVTVTEGAAAALTNILSGVAEGITLENPTYTITKPDGTVIELNEAVKTPGTYTISVTGTLTGDGAEGYIVSYKTGTLTVTKKTALTASIGEGKDQKVYDGQPYAPGTVTFKTADGTEVAVPAENVTYSYEGREDTSYGPDVKAPSDAGKYNLVITVTSDTYTGTTTIPFEITKKEVTVTPSATVTVGDKTAKITYTEDGIVAGDDVTITPNYTLTDASGKTVTLEKALETAGKYTITAKEGKVEGEDAKNYSVTYGTGTLQTVEITVTNPTKRYDGKPAEQGFTVKDADGNEVKVTEGVTYTYKGTDDTEYGPSSEPPTNHGSYYVIVSVDNGTYKGESDPTHFVITNLGIEVTPEDVTVTAGDKQPEFKSTITGVVAADQDKVKIVPTYTITDANGKTLTWDKATANAGTYTITAVEGKEEGVNGNYRVYYKTGKLTVAAATYTLTYNTEGGSTIEPKKVKAGETVALTETPTRKGYIFRGWYADADHTKAIEEIKMDGAATVYALWEVDKTPSLNKADHVAYIIGYPEGDVRPANSITRAEVATIFYRLLTDEVRTANLTDQNNYSDVSEGEWYTNAISTLTKLGILKGDKGATTFRPDDYITREEFAAIAVRFSSVTSDAESSFTDIADSWAKKEIATAEAFGWVEGDGAAEGNTYRPKDNISRAEAMAVVNRMLERAVDEDGLHKDMHKWSDNSDTSAWYYYTVQEATNTHDYTRTDTKVGTKNYNTEKWTAIDADPDWKALEQPLSK